MSIGSIQGNQHGLHGLGKAQGAAQGAQGDDLKIKKLEQELKQIEEGMKLAAMTGNGQLLIMLQQQLQSMMQSAESGGGQDLGGDGSGGGRKAVSFDAARKLDDVQKKAEILAQEIQMQLQSVQAQSGSQGAQGSAFQDQNQAQGRDMRAMYPM